MSSTVSFPLGVTGGGRKCVWGEGRDVSEERAQCTDADAGCVLVAHV